MQMTKILRRAFMAVMSLLLVALVAALAMPAAAAPAEVIALPGATSAEGIAAGKAPRSTPVTCSRATSSAATSTRHR